MGNSQKQEAGDYATQIQASVVNYLGIDEKRAREIYEEKYQIAKQQFTLEAIEIANSRIREFEEKLFPKMSSIEGAIKSFSDPSLQMILLEAQKVAAQSERSSDYDLLTELIAHRAQNSGQREVIAGINRAVKIVNEISDEALQGITITHAVGSIFPASGNVSNGISMLANLFDKLIDVKLPEGEDWIDHLEVLGAIRIVPLAQSFRPLMDIYRSPFDGYICAGIESDSESHKIALGILRENSLPDVFLVNHELLPGHMRLAVVNKEWIQRITLMERSVSGILTRPISNTQIAALERIYSMYKMDNSIVAKNTEELFNRFKSYDSLSKLNSWWGMNRPSFNLTSVGKVLAHANAQRCESTIPAI